MKNISYAEGFLYNFGPIVSCFTGLVLLIFFVPLVNAHELGEEQFINVLSGPHLVSVWADPQPQRVGELHITVALSDPETFAPILGEEVFVQLTYLDDPKIQITSSALNRNASNKLFYEARFNMLNEGEWEGKILLANNENSSESLTFSLSILPRKSIFNLWWIVRTILILSLSFWLLKIWKKSQKSKRFPSRVPKRKPSSVEK